MAETVDDVRSTIVAGRQATWKKEEGMDEIGMSTMHDAA